MGKVYPMDKRCAWCLGNKLYEDYHDLEWGVPCRDDRKLLEFVILEGAQAGLSWLTILRRREHYRNAFLGFDPVKIAAFTEEDVNRLLGNAGIIRNRMKIESAITNARSYLALCEDKGSLAHYLWDFVDGKPLKNNFRSTAEIPATTALSDSISKDMRQRGFRFFGSTICYAHLQATGMVNDHLVSCPRHAACSALA